MTKLTIKTLGGVAVASLLFTGCMGGSENKPEPKKQAQEEFKCKQDGILAPKWTCTPFVQDSISSVGIAKTNAANDKSMQRTEAMADGRDSLASQISTKVSNLFKSYKATTGSGIDATFDATSSKVSKQLASQTLSGSIIFDSWSSPKTNELYLLIGISNKSVKQGMDKAIKSSFKNDKAMYLEFKAAKANGELDKELEK